MALLPVVPAAAVSAVPAVAGGDTKDYIVILKDSVSVAAKVNKETSLGNEVSDVFPPPPAMS